VLGEEPAGNKEYDVFLSYRAATDLAMAREIYYHLVAKGARVYWDRATLEQGATFKGVFARGIASSVIFVPIVSWASLAPIREYTSAEEASRSARCTAAAPRS
jgi:hypothetical protein